MEGGGLGVVYARTSLRGEKREMRQRMRSVGMGYRQIPAEFSRSYDLRPRATWRGAYGWTLQEAAVRINSHRGESGLDPGGICGMTSAHLSEYENWPGNSDVPAGRKPGPLLLAVLAVSTSVILMTLLTLRTGRNTALLIFSSWIPTSGLHAASRATFPKLAQVSAAPAVLRSRARARAVVAAGRSATITTGITAAGAQDRERLSPPFLRTGRVSLRLPRGCVLPGSGGG